MGHAMRRAARGTQGGFDPITGVGWTHAYWAEGGEFAALGLGDGAAVGTWPDEVGTLDATQGTAGSKPTYRATLGPNSKPTVQFDGGDWMLTSTLTQAQPFSLLIVASIDVLAPTKYYVGDAAIKVGLSYNNGGSDLKQLAMYAGAGVTGNSDADYNTSPHMMRGTFNGASSVNDLDGTTKTVSPGSNGISSGLVFGAISNPGVASMQGKLAFFGVYNGNVAADAGWTSFKAWVTSHYGITIA